MDNGSSLKQVTQNILDASYKVYSDVSLINSSLFRAASSLGIDLQEVPQISLAKTSENTFESKTNKHTTADEKGSTGRKISLFHIEGKSKNEGKIDKDITVQPQINMVNEKLKLAESRERKINKNMTALPSVPNYKPDKLEEDKVVVTQPGNRTETKVSIEEKEAKLNKLQAGMPTKLNVVKDKDESQLSPIENISSDNNASSQSELQKTIFETINFGKSFTKGMGEDVNEIANNPLNKLFSLVKERHSITTSQAAQSLNVSKDLIERWAKILSQSSLIRIKYQLMGDMIIEG